MARRPPKNPHGVEIVHGPMTPRLDASGAPITSTPYRPTADACAICPARCCRPTVRLTIPDVVRVASALSLPFDRAFTLVPGTLEHSLPLDHHPALGVEPARWGGTVDLALKRVDERCIFLARYGDYERCGIYSARPSPCRLYPLSWRSDRARGAGLSIRCPIPYAVTDAMERAFIADTNRAIDDLALHEELRADWIAGSAPGARSPRALLDFVVPRAAERLGLPWAQILSGDTSEDRLQRAIAVTGVLG